MRTDCTLKQSETDEEEEAGETGGEDSRCVIVIAPGGRPPKGVDCGARSGEHVDVGVRDSFARVTSIVARRASKRVSIVCLCVSVAEIKGK